LLLVGDVSGDTLDLAGKKEGYVFQVPATGTITDITFFVSGVSTPDGTELTVSLQTVGNDGMPSGTNYGGSAPSVSTAVTTTGSKTIALGTSGSATKGDFVAVVIEMTARTSGSLTIARGVTHSGQTFPRWAREVGAGWTAASVYVRPIINVRYSSTTYYRIHGVLPYTSAHTFWAYDVGQAGADEYGLRFKMPGPATLVGAHIRCRVTAGQTVNLVLYNGTTAVDGYTVAFDGDLSNEVANWVTVMFPSDYALAKDDVRVLSWKPTGTTDTRLYYATAPDAASFATTTGGAEWYAVNRLNEAESWTEDTLIKPFIVPIFSQIDDGAGSGGGNCGSLVAGFGEGPNSVLIIP
jgi:uncharacterized Zn-binding protein involved in type VI secretion